MSQLLAAPPFSARDEAVFLAEMNALCQWHLAGCPEYRRVWPATTPARRLQDLPYLHVGVFKNRLWKTEASGIAHQRMLLSSATSSGVPSKILLDERSSGLQAQSSAAILRNLLGDALRPLAVLDDARSLRRRGEASARVTAALSLGPLASEVQFLLDDADAPESLRWDRLIALLQRNHRLIVYGFTWMLWKGWAAATIPDSVRNILSKAEVAFVHSGGWKKLEAARVDKQQFDTKLLGTVGPGSKILDYYGLVEQVGIIFPLCEAGYRHVPRWAAVLVRDAWSGECLEGTSGLLQFMNVLSWGSPYHSVLTEDLGQLVAGDCPCGRLGQRFQLLGRVPRAELRGCANV